MSHILDLWLENNRTNPENNFDCCGCSACAQKCPQNAITMQYDSEGFLYPVVDESKCIDCGICVKTCPIENADRDYRPYITAFAGYSLDKELLSKCTSGGFITALSLMVIRQGGLVAGVKYTDDFIKSVYSLAKTEKDIYEFSSSKYAQSEKNGIFKEVKVEIQKGTTVLFIGCPCDISALKLFLQKDYENLLTCELICMGVSSYKIAEDYIAYAQKKYKSNLVRINLRSKSKGWFVPHLETEYENGKIVCESLYGTYIGYGMQVYNRPSCFNCHYRGESGVGDLRIGDFWGIKDTDEFWNPDGVSCILARTQKGIDAINRLKDNNFYVYQTDYNVVTQSNMSSTKNKPQKYIDLRKKFAQVYDSKGLIAACRATGSLGFWVKRLVPDGLQASIKKIYHLFVDKR